MSDTGPHGFERQREIDADEYVERDDAYDDYPDDELENEADMDAEARSERS